MITTSDRIKPTPAHGESSEHYTKTEWATGDIITRPKMMNVEDWLASDSDELIEARIGQSANNRESWVTVYYNTIGERMDDLTDYIKKITMYFDLEKIIKYIDDYLAEVEAAVEEHADEAVETIDGYEDAVNQAKTSALTNIQDYLNAVNTAKTTAVEETIPSYVEDVNEAKEEAISSIEGYDNAVQTAASTAQQNIANYDSTTSGAAALAQQNIQNYDSATATAAQTASQHISNYENDVESAKSSALTNIAGKVSAVESAKTTALTDITDDVDDVDNEASEAKTAINKYVDNPTPSAGEQEGVKQVADSAKEEIAELVEEVYTDFKSGYASFTINLSDWNGSGPYTITKNYTKITKEYYPEINLDDTFFNLNASLTVSCAANGTITIST